MKPAQCCEDDIWGDGKGPFTPLNHRSPRAHCSCQNIIQCLINVTHSNTLLSLRTPKPIQQERCEPTCSAIPSPPISVFHWVCSFVPLLQAPMCINLCKCISDSHSQTECQSWAQWTQDSLLQTHWWPNDAPCSLTACSKGLIYTVCPGEQALILLPTEVHTLSSWESS